MFVCVCVCCGAGGGGGVYVNLFLFHFFDGTLDCAVSASGRADMAAADAALCQRPT